MSIGTSAPSVWQLLQRAIAEVCRLRGDDDANHQSLVDECAAQPAEMQADLLAHFEDVARLYRAALKIVAPEPQHRAAAASSARGARP